MTANQQVSPSPDCVEVGIWTKIPVPPPGALSLKLKDVDKNASHAIKAAGVMSFHAVGCTGARESQEATARVAEAMAVQVAHRNRFGGTATAASASFLYHLGDVVYKKDKESQDDLLDDQADAADEHTDFGTLYDTQFYAPYKSYGLPIFALAGNHDGKDKPGDKPRKSAIRHYLKNFCGQDDGHPSDNKSSARTPMRQPYPYWLFETPLAYFVGLYTNVSNAGQLDDPTNTGQPQFDWLVETLSSIKAAGDGKAVLLALHYPPYSAAANFLERGNPNLGPSAPSGKTLQPLGMLLQQAFQKSGQFPDMVISAHAHLYQRLTYTYADGRQIPYLIAGAGGHGPVEKLSTPCHKGEHAAGPPAAPAVVFPPRLTLPPGDRIELAAANDTDFGFLRITLDRNQQVLTGEYFAAFSATPPSQTLPALDDSFALDLRTHTIR